MKNIIFQILDSWIKMAVLSVDWQYLGTACQVHFADLKNALIGLGTVVTQAHLEHSVIEGV